MLRARTAGRLLFIAVLVIVVSLGCGSLTAYALDTQQKSVLHELQDGFTAIAEEVQPSVVSITSTATMQVLPQNLGELFKDMPFPFAVPDAPSKPEKKTVQSFGSGVIVRSDGYILTNDHVVGGTDKVSVKLKDGREFIGTVLHDPKSDLAVVKIDAKDLPAAKLGSSDKMKVGYWAIAIGNPFGLDQTVTVGVVSALNRKEEVQNKFYPNLIQTDASINPGNSGGPLINIDGEVIGITTLIRSSNGGSVGIGFAIPVDNAKFVMGQLIDHGAVVRGYLGIGPADLTSKDAERYGVAEGALVMTVQTGSPADKAGVQLEDVIIQIGDKKIRGETDLRETIASIPPGTKVNIIAVRNKEKKTLSLVIGDLKESEVAAMPGIITNLGLAAADLTPELAGRLGLPAGTRGIAITAVDPNGPAADYGLEPGMVIIRANDHTIASLSELNQATSGLKSGDMLRLHILTKERIGMLTIPIP
ncbi:MAG: Do family serine endopeptidase [Armatimonadota bacterium]